MRIVRRRKVTRLDMGRFCQLTPLLVTFTCGSIIHVNPFKFIEIARQLNAGSVKLDHLGPRWHNSCIRLSCWKASFLDNVIEALARSPPVTTGIFSHLLFHCPSAQYSSNTAPKSSRVFKVLRSDICCFEEYLTRLPQSNISLVAVTHGHDNYGSPFNADALTMECFVKILQDNRIKSYFVSQHRSDFQHPKIKFLPIGLGTATYKLKLNWCDIMAIVSKAARKYRQQCSQNICSINTIEANFNSAGVKSGEARSTAFAMLRRALDIPITNVYKKFNSRTILERYAASAFVFSPAGTHYDCWRHHEALLMGAFALVDDHYSLHSSLPGLPVIYVKNWTQLTREELLSDMDSVISTQLPSALPLTRSYWEKQVESWL